MQILKETEAIVWKYYGEIYLEKFQKYIIRTLSGYDSNVDHCPSSKGMV